MEDEASCLELSFDDLHACLVVMDTEGEAGKKRAPTEYPNPKGSQFGQQPYAKARTMESILKLDWMLLWWCLAQVNAGRTDIDAVLEDVDKSINWRKY